MKKSYVAFVLVLSLVLTACTAQNTTITEGLVDIGTHSLYIHCLGEGDPTVVIDVGHGESYLKWESIQGRIAEETRVCAYDRAGYGRSEPGPLPRDGEREAAELKLLLEKAGIEGPYLLVGHSLGALNMQVFAHKYPESTAGMILLDPTPLGFLSGERFPKSMELYKHGVDELVASAEAAEQFGDPDGLAAGSFLRILASELAEGAGKTAQQLSAIESFGDLPLIVIGAEKPNPNFGEDAEAFQQFWIDQNRQLATQSTQGSFILAEGSEHQIHLDAPDVVEDAILQTLTKVRD